MKILTNSKTMIENLKRIGINSSFDVTLHLPYRYENYQYSLEDNISDKQKVVLLGRLVSSCRLVHAKGLDITSFYFSSVNNKLYLVKAYNRPYLNKILNLKDEFTLQAIFNEQRKEMVLVNIKKGQISEEERLKAIYHLSNDISNSSYSSLVKRTLDKYQVELNKVLPDYLNNKYHLMNHFDALKSVHFPKNESDLSSGLRTLKFEECLEYCLRNQIIREDNKKLEKTIINDIDLDKINEFVKNLSFKLSKDQLQAVKEIVLDLKKPTLMYRLLQGDVGTGKTLVALVGLYANFLRGEQGVFLAPTISLVDQQFEYINNLLKPYGVNVCKISGANTQKEKRTIINDLKEGKIDILVGTHAVFSKMVEYKNFSFAVIDEQHRFGVNQRNILFSKGEQVDLLLMSATPIPRTLSLSLYGDLDVSSLTSFPMGKRNVKTLVVDYESDKIRGLIDYCLKNNSQVFMVCPKINSNYSNTKSVKEIFDKYQPIYQDKIALLHGKMNNEEKRILLDNFRNNITPILVATSIVELGIDIKTASGIIIFSSNSFGLASLHQLRGRVGRSSQEGFCLLVDEENGEHDLSRLKFLEKCSDGFEISEEDMRLRGPGDYNGLQQSGFPSFNSLNIVSDFKMFIVSRDEATYIMNHLDNLDILNYYNLIRNKISSEEKELTLFD